MKIHELLDINEKNKKSSDYTTGANPEFSKKVADQNKKSKKEADNKAKKAVTKENTSSKVSEKFGVFRKGGSIGSHNDDPVATFDTKDEAIEKAKRLRKTLTKGEKGYYKMGFLVRQIKENCSAGASGAGSIAAAPVGIGNVGPHGVGINKKSKKSKKTKIARPVGGTTTRK